jgi:hypothetical protein
MRRAFALAAIPVLVWAAWPTAAPLKPIMVATEGVRAQRQDENTFRLRWASVNELPPAVTRIDTARGQQTAVGEPSSAATTPHRRLVVKRVKLDICQRHNMRKVHYGKRWRCRR